MWKLIIADATAIFVPPPLAAEAILDVSSRIHWIELIIRLLQRRFLSSWLSQKEFLNMIWPESQPSSKIRIKLV